MVTLQMAPPTKKTFRHSRSHVARAERNANLITSNTVKRVGTGLYAKKYGRSYQIYRDMFDGSVYDRISFDPINLDAYDDPDTVITQREIIREGTKSETALFLVLPSGTFKRRFVSRKKTQFYIVVNGQRINLDK